jgi:hypothetical protein
VFVQRITRPGHTKGSYVYKYGRAGETNRGYYIVLWTIILTTADKLE